MQKPNNVVPLKAADDVEVSLAYLHSGIAFPPYFQMQTTLATVPHPKSTIPAEVTMSLTGLGLVLRHSSGARCIIPSANVKVCLIK